MDTNEAKKLKKKRATGIILVMFKTNYKFFLALLISTLFPWNDLKADSENTLNMLSIEPGFKIEIFVDNIDTPRQIAQSTSGNIFVGSKNGGIITAILPDKSIRTIAKGLKYATGVTFYDGDLYFSEINNIWKIENIDQHLEQSMALPQKTLVTNNLPSNPWHGWKWIDFGPDGYLYLAVGVPCNVCNPADEAEYDFDKRFGAILRLSEDNQWEYVATGVRNSVGFDWHPTTKKLYFGDNGRDWMGDDLPSCELNRVDLEGQSFGFPFKHATNVLDPEYGSKITNDMNFVDPILEIGAHVAPTGLTFYDGEMLPKKYKNTIFMALHGSWNRTRKSGYKILAAHFDDQGALIGYEDFITGWLQREGTKETVLGRPANVFQMQDGSLLISDDKANAIFRVSY